MKKLLLLLTVFSLGSATNAQVFWVEKSTGFTAASRGVNQVSYADGNNVWITVYDGITTTNVIREFARSTNGGDTWTPGVINLGLTTLGVGCISAIDATTAYVSAFPDTGGLGGIWKTINGGTTWTKQATATYSSADSFANNVYFWDANNGVTMGDPDPTNFEIYTTTNGGTNWVRVPSGNIPLPLDAAEFGYTRSFAVAGGVMWFGTDKGRLYKSTNKGLNWTVNATPITDFQDGNVAFQDANNGLLISDDWQFFRTIDGGVTWTPEAPTGVYRNGSISAVPGTCAYVSIGNDLDLDEDGSSYSSDGGLNWVDVNSLGDDTNTDNATEVSFYDATHGLASGFNTSSTVGGIFKFVGHTVDPQIFECPLATTSYTTAKTFIASPNPTSGALKLSGKNISSVVVYDVLGKEVSNTNYSALNNVSLDLSSYNNGVYMVKVSTGAGVSETIKVVKQ